MRSLMIGSLVLCVLLQGCAMPPEKRMSSRLLRTAVDDGPYNRNVIVCAPTRVGLGIFTIGVGLPVMIVGATPILVLTFFVTGGEGQGIEDVQPTRLRSAFENTFDITIDAAAVSTSVGGLLLGAPFIPLSYLTQEKRCKPLHFHEVFRRETDKSTDSDPPL